MQTLPQQQSGDQLPLHSHKRIDPDESNVDRVYKASLLLIRVVITCALYQLRLIVIHTEKKPGTEYIRAMGDDLLVEIHIQSLGEHVTRVSAQAITHQGGEKNYALEVMKRGESYLPMGSLLY